MTVALSILESFSAFTVRSDHQYTQMQYKICLKCGCLVTVRK